MTTYLSLIPFVLQCNSLYLKKDLLRHLSLGAQMSELTPSPKVLIFRPTIQNCPCTRRKVRNKTETLFADKMEVRTNET